MDLEIKEALLDKEKEAVRSFLSTLNLGFDDDIEHTFYISDGNKIVGTISHSSYVIKCLGVDEEYQGYNLASKLVLAIIIHLKKEGIYSYFAFTLIKNKNIFLSLGFSLIAQTDNVCLFEGGVTNIDTVLNSIKEEYKINTFNNGAVIINGNPITNGHLYLINEACKYHDKVLLFVVETDLSEYSFKERFMMIKQATKDLDKVIVIPSTKYIISRATFPTYFIKEDSKRSLEYASLDVLIFKSYFMRILNIYKRYIGEETHPMMVMYNNILKETLKNNLVVVKRKKYLSEVISASKFRKLVNENNLDEALKLVPIVNHQYLINKHRKN